MSFFGNQKIDPKAPDWIIQCKARQDAKELDLLKNVKQDYIAGINASWEIKTAETIKRNKSKAVISQLREMQAQQLDDRRGKLSALFRDEKAMYEAEIQSQEHDASQQMEVVRQRALALKEKREGARKKIVEEKLYQQWRQSIDDLRTSDVKLCELQTMAALDQQVIDKEERVVFDKMLDEAFDQQWNDQYRERVAREKREIVDNKKRNEVMQNCIRQQIELRQAEEEQERVFQEQENIEARRLHKQHLEEEQTRKARETREAREEAIKMGGFKKIADKIRADKVQEEKDFDKTRLMLALKKEMEEEIALQEKAKEVKAEAMAYMADQDLEKANTKAINLFLDQCMLEEADKAFAKREAIWDKEAAARHKLLVEVYGDRWNQIELKKQQQLQRMNDVQSNRKAMQMEIDRLQTQEDRKVAIEHAMRKEHQEALCKQMDYHQLNHERSRQQAATEARQAELTEQHFAETMGLEKAKQAALAVQLREHREVQQRQDALAQGIRSCAPWERTAALAAKGLTEEDLNFELTAKQVGGDVEIHMEAQQQ